MLKKLDFVTDSMYDYQESASNGGVAMTAQEALTAALEATENTQAYAARKIGWMPQRLNQRLIRGTLRVDEMFRLLDAIGVDFQMTVRETGTPVKIHTAGYGRRVRAMSERIMFDTSVSDALSNSFFEDGEHEYGPDGRASELYIDREGRYFLAMYSNVEGERDRVQAINGDLAAAYIEKYGTKIVKLPKNEQDI